MDYSKYHRNKPIKEFDVNQTMYSMIESESKDSLDLNATGFLGNSMTYKELFDVSDKLASAFLNSGVSLNDNVAILTISMPIVQEALLALSKIGATMSWIDLRTKPKDLIKYINNSNSKAIIVFEDILPLVKETIDETDVKKVIVVSPKDYLSPVVKVLATLKDMKENKKVVLPDDPRFIKFSDFIKTGSNDLVIPAKFEKDKPSLIVQSSGSTGKPKQIVHTEYNFNSEMQKMAYLDLPLYKGSTMHISVPPFIIYGLGNSIYASMAFTMKGEMNPHVDENTVYNDLGKFDVSFAAPLHYRYIYEKLTHLKEDIETLEKDDSYEARKELKHKMKELERVLNGINHAKVFVSGGDKIGADELKTMEHEFDKTIVNGYGNNECLGAAIVSPMYANKPGSIGIPMKGVDARVVNPDTYEEVAQGEIGELLISTDNLFVKYLNNEEETNKIKVTLDGKTWVKTGDLCIVDGDGYIIPKGRNRRLIKKEAFKISPDTIEEVIKSLSFVKDCVVVGVDDAKSLSVPMAFVVLNDLTVNFEDAKAIIQSKCEEELPDYEVPSYYEEIEKIPYTPNDKQDFRYLENLGNEIVKNKYSRNLRK
ncbi:MAG: class I adenylate-forming enzyme family protein [Bacilli bacterium]|nr:class I adenylate-forming enzyme family protein [Bacilli bacterium]